MNGYDITRSNPPSIRLLKYHAPMARLRTHLTSRHWVYLSLNLVLVAVGVTLLRGTNAALSAVGSALVATGIAGIVLFVWVLMNEERANRLELLTRIGLVEAYSARSTRIKSEYDSRVESARQSIDILGFGLSQLLEDYAGDFPAWAARARVRVLLIDPTGPAQFADQRDREEMKPIGTIRNDVNDFLRRTEPLRSSTPQQFQVRLYRTLPSVNIFRVDDEIFWGPYLLNTPSRNTPTFLIRRGGALFDVFLNQFEALWGNSIYDKP